MIYELKVKLNDGSYAPTRSYKDDAGLDLRTPYEFTVYPKDARTVDTGTCVMIPKGYWGKLESKSGLNVKHGIVSLGGTIDAGYTGSIKVKLYNFGEEPYTFHAGDKIVQLIIMPCETRYEMVMVDDFGWTERGEDGFGSTGK